MLVQTQTHTSERARDPATALTVFVVENHEDTRALLRLLLETLGHRVVSAQSMNEALERLPAAGCDVLISDIGLPDGDGWELMRRLQLPYPIYAVAISGFGMSSDCARSRAVGYRHHLVKPYGVERLPAILEEAASERRRRNSRQRVSEY